MVIQGTLRDVGGRRDRVQRRLGVAARAEQLPRRGDQRISRRLSLDDVEQPSTSSERDRRTRTPSLPISGPRSDGSRASSPTTRSTASSSPPTRRCSWNTPDAPRFPLTGSPRSSPSPTRRGVNERLGYTSDGFVTSPHQPVASPERPRPRPLACCVEPQVVPIEPVRPEEIPLRGVIRHGGGPSACEHVFVTSQGSAYSRFQRSLTTGNLQLIEAAARRGRQE